MRAPAAAVPVSAPQTDGTRWRLSAALAVRLGCGAGLVAVLLVAARAPVMPAWLLAMAAVIVVASVWRPAVALPLVVAAAPFGELAADVPVRATDTLLMACFAGWLLRLHAPLVPGRVPRAVAVPALAFAAIAVLSWAAIVADRAMALGPGPFARQSLLMFEYLVTAGRDPQTAAMVHLLLMVATCLSVPALASRGDAGTRVVLAVAGAGFIAAVVTLGPVLVPYIQTWDSGMLVRYFEGRYWRQSVHLSDVNAAGSHYALAALVTLGLAVQLRRARWVAVPGILLMTIALWLTASRMAILAIVLGLGIWGTAMVVRRPPGAARGLRSRLVGTSLAGVAGLSLLLVWMWLPPQGEHTDPGLDLRTGFLLTSARMLATAPVSGTGVGTYYERSPSFMPPHVRQAYPDGENAHNYFAQVAVELGVVGGVVFIWWIGALLWILWRGTAEARVLPLQAGLLAGCTAYLLTCLTGHPLLVMEATVPFWAAAGAGLALGIEPGGLPHRPRRFSPNASRYMRSTSATRRPTE